jgi:hypothetical protein
MRLILLIAPLSTCLGFSPSPFRPPSLVASSIISPAVPSPPPLSSSSSSQLSSRGGAEESEDDDARPRRRSRFEGMQREPTPADIAIIDDMITKMGNAKPYELPNAVSRAMRVVSSPQFFLRIAERADAASDREEREKLSE